MLWRMFALIVAIVLFSLLISGIFLLYLSSGYWKERTLGELSSDAQTLANSMSLCMEYYDAETIFSSESVYLPVVSAVRSVVNTSDCQVLVLAGDGRVVLCSDSLDPEDFSQISVCGQHQQTQLDNAVLSSIASVSDGQGWQHDGVVAGISEEEYITAAQVVRTDGRIRYFVLLMEPKKLAFRALSAKYSGMVIFSSSVAVALSFVAAYFVSYRVVLPLKKISEATQQYAKGDFSLRINASDTYNEVRDLADSVNSMAEDLSVIETSRSHFVANVSHELKTPMTIISGFIDGILDGTIDESEREKYLTVVSDETKRLSRLVVDLLNMSKIEAGKLTLEVSSVELSTLLMKIMLIFEAKITEKRITVEGVGELPRTVITADEGLINQVFFNIIDNAVKFTPEGGAIGLSLTASKKTVTVSVRNTGKGIPEEEQNRIFERFYKVDKSRGLDAKSFGIGLSIAKSIVELHKGEICINSFEDDYTEFVVTLPTEA